MDEAHVIIDTGRNGVTDMRTDCKNWCNPRNAGTGIPSTTDVANKSLVDAYFWLKTPGESDGCSQTLENGEKCPRFDTMCGAVDAIGTKTDEPPAPEAGGWFDYQVKQLALNARFEPDEGSSTGKCAASAGVAQQPQQVQSVYSGSTYNQPAEPSKGSTGPVSSGGSCSGAYQQCGGKTWSGPMCCQTGCTCHGSQYYKQCQPPSGLYTCGGGSSAAATLAQPQPQPQMQPRPRPRPKPQQTQREQDGFVVGDHVTWIHEDSDVPKGTVGTVVRFLDSGVVVQFPRGQWGFKPEQLRRKPGEATIYMRKDEVITSPNIAAEWAMPTPGAGSTAAVVVCAMVALGACSLLAMAWFRTRPARMSYGQLGTNLRPPAGGTIVPGGNLMGNEESIA